MTLLAAKSAFVVTKFWTGFLITIFISSMMAVLLELVALMAKKALLTSPSMAAIGQQRTYENWQSLLVALTTFKLLLTSVTSLSSQDLLDNYVIMLIGPVSPKKENVESKMENLPKEQNLSLRVTCFNSIQKSKPSNKSKPWMITHVRAKIRNRTTHHKQQEWTEACREVT